MITGLGINAVNPRGIGVEGVVLNANASGLEVQATVVEDVVAATKGIGAVGGSGSAVANVGGGG